MDYSYRMSNSPPPIAPSSSPESPTTLVEVDKPSSEITPATSVERAVPAGVSTPESLLAEIREEADLLPEEVARLRVVDRLDIMTDRWMTGASPPGNDKLYLLAMFGGNQFDEDSYVPGDVRAYAIPKSAIVQPTDPVFFCYTLSRVNPTVTRESMIRETFVNEVAEELRALAVFQEIVEEDDDDEEPEETSPETSPS